MDKFEAQIEQETRRKYSGENGEYKPETISHLPDAQSKDFSQQLLCVKFDLVRNIAPGAVILDLGCGNGAHAIELAKIAKKVYGVDYSPVFVTFAENAARSHGMSNVQFLARMPAPCHLVKIHSTSFTASHTLLYASVAECFFRDSSGIETGGKLCA